MCCPHGFFGSYWSLGHLVALPDDSDDAHDAEIVMIATAASNGEDHVTDERGVFVNMADDVHKCLAHLIALREQLHDRTYRENMLRSDITVTKLAAVWDTAISVEAALGSHGMVAIDGVKKAAFYAHEFSRRRREHDYYRPNVPDLTHGSPGLF